MFFYLSIVFTFPFSWYLFSVKRSIQKIFSIVFFTRKKCVSMHFSRRKNLHCLCISKIKNFHCLCLKKAYKEVHSFDCILFLWKHMCKAHLDCFIFLFYATCIIPMQKRSYVSLQTCKPKHWFPSCESIQYIKHGNNCIYKQRICNVFNLTQRICFHVFLFSILSFLFSCFVL